MKALFYKKDVEHIDCNGKKVVEKDVLHFKLSTNIPVMQATSSVDFDDRAIEDHKKAYADAYNAFLESEKKLAEPVEPVEEVKELPPTEAEEMLMEKEERFPEE